jgi:hypothetical protein
MIDLIRREDVYAAIRSLAFNYDRIAAICAIPAVQPVTVQAQIDEAMLRRTLHNLITEQSEGEWDDKTISKDVESFLTAILALIRKGDQP